MIKLHDINGRVVYLAPANIASVTEASASSQWHGIRAIVRTFDGSVHEVCERPTEVVDAVRVQTEPPCSMT